MLMVSLADFSRESVLSRNDEIRSAAEPLAVCCSLQYMPRTRALVAKPLVAAACAVEMLTGCARVDSPEEMSMGLRIGRAMSSAMCIRDVRERGMKSGSMKSLVSRSCVTMSKT